MGQTCQHSFLTVSTRVFRCCGTRLAQVCTHAYAHAHVVIKILLCGFEVAAGEVGREGHDCDGVRNTAVALAHESIGHSRDAIHHGPSCDAPYTLQALRNTPQAIGHGPLTIRHSSIAWIATVPAESKAEPIWGNATRYAVPSIGAELRGRDRQNDCGNAVFYRASDREEIRVRDGSGASREHKNEDADEFCCCSADDLVRSVHLRPFTTVNEQTQHCALDEAGAYPRVSDGRFYHYIVGSTTPFSDAMHTSTCNSSSAISIVTPDLTRQSFLMPLPHHPRFEVSFFLYYNMAKSTGPAD